MSTGKSTFHCDRGAILLPPKPELTGEGYLRCFLRIGKTGELAYRHADGTEQIEVVSPEVLFAKDSIDSFKMKPITYPHPPVKVRSDNAMQYQRGLLGHYAVIDGDFLGFVGSVTDKQAVEALLSGTATEASCGYDTVTKLRGDGKLDQLRRDGNHVAIVPRGRAGADVRFHVDSESEPSWYQVEAPTDLYNADSDTVREVFKDIQTRQIWDLGGKRADAEAPQEQSTKLKTKDRSMMISFPSGRVFNVDDEDLAAEILALLGDDDDLLRVKGMGYSSYMDAVDKLKAKADAAEGTATGLQSQITEFKTKLDAVEGSRMDADTIATEVSARADAWSAVLPLLRLDTPDFQPDYKLDVAAVRKLAIAKKVSHLNLDGKSAEFVNAVWDTIAPALKDVERKDSTDDLLAALNASQRSDGLDAADPADAKESARAKYTQKIEKGGRE